MSFRLDTVNRCLKAIGEDPVSSLATSLAEAGKASDKLDEITREVLSTGWQNNTDFNVVVTPDVNGQIVITDDIISIDTSGRSISTDVTVRVDPSDDIKKLFDKTNQTFVFTDPLYVDIIRYFDIDALPFALQNYIAALTARRFQVDELGNAIADAELVRDENRAWTLLLDEEADADDSNILTDSYYMRVVTGRNNPLYAR